MSFWLTFWPPNTAIPRCIRIHTHVNKIRSGQFFFEVLKSNGQHNDRFNVPMSRSAGVMVRTRFFCIVGHISNYRSQWPTFGTLFVGFDVPRYYSVGDGPESPEGRKAGRRANQTMLPSGCTDGETYWRRGASKTDTTTDTDICKHSNNE